MVPMKTRLINMTKWSGTPLLWASGYAWIILGCVGIRNPLPKMVVDYEPEQNDDSEPGASLYIMDTLGAGVTGAIGTCCGVITCCGFGGAYSPKEFL